MLAATRLLFAFLVTLCISQSAARRLHTPQQQKVEPGTTAPIPVAIGDGSAKVLSQSYMLTKGGAIAALGRPTLVQLKRNAKFHGSVEALARHIDTDGDLVSGLILVVL